MFVTCLFCKHFFLCKILACPSVILIDQALYKYFYYCLQAEDVLTLFESVVDVEQGQVITIDVSEPHLGLVCLFLHFSGPHEALRN